MNISSSYGLGEAVLTGRLLAGRTVHIADPDARACEALGVLFRYEGFQTTFSGDLQSLDQRLQNRCPDVVIASTHIGQAQGVELLHLIKAKHSGVPVFLLADAADVKTAVAALRAGATDVVPKPIDTEYLLSAVREALRRNVHVGIVQGGRRIIEVRGFPQLTARERQVLQLVTEGHSNKEAGRELGISPRTIEVHRARVMKKLGARNTADLLRIVLTS